MTQDCLEKGEDLTSVKENWKAYKESPALSLFDLKSYSRLLFPVKRNSFQIFSESFFFKKENIKQIENVPKQDQIMVNKAVMMKLLENLNSSVDLQPSRQRLENPHSKIK